MILVPQTPKKKLENAVSELETQIDECIPLFAANSNPVGDLDKLLQVRVLLEYC